MRYRTSISYHDDLYNDSISHPKIIEAYQYLQLNHDDILKECDNIIIRTNGYKPYGFSIWINFIGPTNINIPDSIPYNIYINNKYIRGIEYIEEEFELINSHIIRQKQHPHTFFQSDDIIRLFIYNYIYEHYSHLNKIALFGGEFYLYSQLFTNPEITHCFTDSKDLYDDAIYSYSDNNSPNHFNLIDYNTYTISTVVEADIIIIQVSPNGLKPNLLKQILKIKSKHIIYIGCKKDIVDRDIKFLGYEQKYYENMGNNVFMVDLVDRSNNLQEEQILISLGGDCSVAYQLEQCGYRSCAYPFDWIRSSLDDIISLLRNNFDEFVDGGQLLYKRSTDNFKFVIDNNEENVQVECGHIYQHKKYKSIQFCHDFVDDTQSNLVQVQEQYRRRITRFQQTIYSKSCIFIRYETGKLTDDILSKWEKLVALPLVIITGNPRNEQYTNQQKFGKYITFIKDISSFNGWKRDNFPWATTFKSL